MVTTRTPSVSGAEMVAEKRNADMIFPIYPALFRNDGGCLNLDLGAILDKGNDLHGGHGREVPADDLAIHLADGFQEGDDILKCLAPLLDEVVAFDLAGSIPADLTADEHHAAGCRHAIGIADRLGPAFRLQDGVHRWSPDERSVRRGYHPAMQTIDGCLVKWRRRG